MSTGLYCTKCGTEFEEDEGVLLVDIGSVERITPTEFFTATGNSPYLHQLCYLCAPVLQAERQRPNRVVVEVYDDMAWRNVLAERPEGVVVIMHPLNKGHDLAYGGPDGVPIGPLNTVKEEA